MKRQQEREAADAVRECERIGAEELELESKRLPELGHDQQIPAETDGIALPGTELDGLKVEPPEMQGDEGPRYELHGDDLVYPEVGE